MNTLTKRFQSLAVFSLLVALVALGAAPREAAAQSSGETSKNIAVISFSGYNALMEDINFIGSLSGQPEMAKNLEGMLAFFTQGQGLSGMEKGKPWGAVVRPAAQGPPEALGFIPVSNLQQLLDLAAGFQVNVEKGADGVIKLEPQQGQSFCIKEQDGWAFIAQRPDQLTDLPADPAKLLGGLNEKYDLAVRLDVQNVPDEAMNMMLSAIKAGAEAELYQREDEDEDAFNLRKQTVESALQQIDQLIHDLNYLQVGVAVDSNSRKALLEFQIAAVPQSKLAKQMAASTGLTSQFGGFMSDQGAVTMNLLAKMSDEDVQQSVTLINGIRPKIMEGIDEESELPDDASREVAKSLVSDLLDVTIDTIKGGTLDAAAELHLETGSLTLVAGGQVADGAKIESALKRIAKLAENEPDFPGVKWNADSHEGVNFHVMEIPVPEQNVRKVLGNTVEMVFGIGAKSVYFAFGADGVEKLKKAIDASKQSGGRKLPLMSATASMTKIMNFAAAQDSKPETQMAAMLFSEAAGKDHISLAVNADATTATYRLEVEEGVLKAMIKGAQMARQGGPGGPGGF